MIQSVIKLKDSYTSTCTKVISSAKKLDKALANNSASYSKMNNKVSSVMSKIKSKFQNVWNATKKPFKWAIDTRILKTLSKITGAIGKITSKLVRLSSKVFKVTLKPAGMLAKGGMKLAKLGAGAFTVTGAGVLGMAKMGSDLEVQKISMNHFLGGDSKKSDAYLKELRENANATPFETGEVVKAGTRAIQIADGDTKKGMDFVKLAEDMAALNPGKTISDAMEALADANLGEMERLKEFGFKGSKKEFDKAGGDLFKMKGANGKTLQDLYKGGAGKLAGSAKGKLSTITGKVKSGLQDAGLKVIEKMAPILDKLIPLADILADKIVSFVDIAMPYVESFIQGIGVMWQSIQPIIQQIMPILQSAWGALSILVKPLVDLGSTLIPIFAEALSFVSPIIDGVVKPAFEMIGMIISNALCPVLKLLWSVLSVVLTPVIKIVSVAFQGLKPVVEMVTNLVGGLAGALKGAIEKIGGLAKKAWSGIKGAGKWIYNKVTGHATGSEYFSGGLTRINERGEELINLPRGTKIYPSGKTNQIMNRELKGNNAPNNTYNLTVNISTGGEINEEKLGQILLNKFKEFAPQGA